MASMIKCDKCGVSGSDVSKFMHIRAHRLVDVESFRSSSEKHMDVCMNCYKEIFKRSEDKNDESESN